MVLFITLPNGNGFCFNMAYFEGEKNRHLSSESRAVIYERAASALLSRCAHHCSECSGLPMYAAVLLPPCQCALSLPSVEQSLFRCLAAFLGYAATPDNALSNLRCKKCQTRHLDHLNLPGLMTTIIYFLHLYKLFIKLLYNYTGLSKKRQLGCVNSPLALWRVHASKPKFFWATLLLLELGPHTKFKISPPQASNGSSSVLPAELDLKPLVTGDCWRETASVGSASIQGRPQVMLSRGVPRTQKRASKFKHSNCSLSNIQFLIYDRNKFNFGTNFSLLDATLFLRNLYFISRALNIFKRLGK